MVQSEDRSLPNNAASSPGSTQISMIDSLDLLRSKLESRASNGTILAILQGTPCLAKCSAEIKSPHYGGNVDQFYIAKHDYARISLVDRIAQDLSNGFVVGAETVTNVGKLDVAITNQKIVVSNGNKKIGVEVKSGKGGVDLFQLIRYLFEVDKLVVARVATTDVVIIKKSDIADQLDKISSSVQYKIGQIIEGQRYKVAGPWCDGCTVECEYRKKKSTSHYVAKMEGLADFVNNVGATVEKTILILKEELAAQ